MAEHAEEVAHATALVHGLNPVDAVRSVFNAAMSHKVRQDAPLAGCSIDRTALRNFSEATADDNVEALMCFSCACIHTYVQDSGTQGPISWYKPLVIEPSTHEFKFLGARLPDMVNLIGLDPFLKRYGNVKAIANFTESAELDDWTLRLPGNHGALLCCPEDHKCAHDAEHVVMGCSL